MQRGFLGEISRPLRRRREDDHDLETAAGHVPPVDTRSHALCQTANEREPEARFLAAATPFATALAVWGFFLVQSVFFLVGGVQPRREPGPQPDPFEDAHARALALLDGVGV
jgi:hypothetical protein